MPSSRPSTGIERKENLVSAERTRARLDELARDRRADA